MQGQTAVVLGSTGLIGSQLLQLLLDDNDFTTVRIVVRKPVTLSHPKLLVHVVAFNDYADMKEKIGMAHSIFCCVGTTQKKVGGDKNAYRKVDYDIPVNSAHAGIENGCKKYLLVSSVNANKDSRNFYLQLKGTVEEAISKLPFESVHLFRPSILIGNRDEVRPGEKIAQVSMKWLSFLFQGSLKKYKPIDSLDVAKAMIATAKKDAKGVKIYEYAEIKSAANQ